MKKCIIFSISFVSLFLDYLIHASGNRTLAKIVRPKQRSDLDISRLNELRNQVARGEVLNSQAKTRLVQLLERVEPGIVYPLERAQLEFALVPDVNQIHLSEQTVLGSSFQYDYNRIGSLLRNPNYNLLLMDSNGQRRLDMVMNFPVHIYSDAIRTALNNRNHALLDAMAQHIVDRAESGEEVVATVRNLREYNIDERFIDNVFRRAFERFI
ncbi:hypothetical protein KAZ82_00635 [Candidatus Babeliales bacterium]|nr:hypothetical protein [Candidatus Babeliales bacterium]